MCLVCTEFAKGKMTALEGLKALGETVDGDLATEEELDHFMSTINTLTEAAEKEKS